MKHLSEEHLILHYYGETNASEHLAVCPACSAELKRLATTLDAFDAYQVPERPADYEALLWQRIAADVRPRQTAPWWKRPLVLSPVLAGLMVAAFFAGRISTMRQPRGPIVVASAGISDTGRQRILMAELGDHLERSQVVLVELAHGGPGDESIKRRAQDLVYENRLYRQTAAQAGNREFDAILDELERVLTDAANGQGNLSAGELERLEKLLFKVRVVGNNLQQKESKEL